MEVFVEAHVIFGVCVKREIDHAGGTGPHRTIALGGRDIKFRREACELHLGLPKGALGVFRDGIQLVGCHRPSCLLLLKEHAHSRACDVITVHIHGMSHTVVSNARSLGGLMERRSSGVD